MSDRPDLHKIDQVGSQRLAVLRFPLIVGVVFIHAYDANVGVAGAVIGQSDYDWFSVFLRNLVSQGVARVAVPLFFLIAGYFLFLGAWSSEIYLQKLRTRVGTLLVPFLIWNAGILVLFAVAQALPLARDFFSGRNAQIASLDAFGYLNLIFGLNKNPVAHQFWFIRDLMILVVLSPALHFLLRRFPWPLIFIFAVCWFFSAWMLAIPSIEATFFFATGAMIAMRDKSLFAFDRRAAFILAIYLFLQLLDAAMPGTVWHPYLHRAAVAFGVLSALCISRNVVRVERLRICLIALGGASFFIFAAHEPFLTILRKFAFSAVRPESGAMVIALYFLIPIFVIVLLIYVYRAGVAWAPGFMRVITGGR